MGTETNDPPTSTLERVAKRTTGPWRALNRFAANTWLPKGAKLRPGAGALAVEEFRRFWIGSIVSNVGSWMQYVAQGWLILQLTDSPFYLGLIGLVRAVPALSLTLVGGVLADRFDRRKILIFTQTSAGALALLLGILDLTGVITIWQLLVIAFFSSAVMAIDNPTRQALVPDLVGRENIASAVGLNSAAWNGAAVIGPSLAGVLVAIISTAGAFLLNGISYFAVVYAVWKITPRPQRPRGNQSAFQHLVDGLHFVVRDRRIWGLVAIVGVATFFGRPYMQLMPIFAQDVLHRGSVGYGVLMGATGIGALIGALTVGTIGSSKRKGFTLLLMTGLFGVTLLLFSLSHWFVPSLLALVVVGATQTLFMAITNTLLQLNVPEEMRGRIMAVYTLVPSGLMPLGSMALGSLGSFISVPLTIDIAAVIVVIFTILAYRLLPDVRRMP